MYLTLQHGYFGRGNKRADKNVQVDMEVLNEHNEPLPVWKITYNDYGLTLISYTQTHTHIRAHTHIRTHTHTHTQSLTHNATSFACITIDAHVMIIFEVSI